MKCKPWIRHFQPRKFQCFSSQFALHGLRAPWNKFQRFSFIFAFAMIMLGTHKSQQQATITKIDQIPEVIFRFHFCNQLREKPKSRNFCILLVIVSKIRVFQFTMCTSWFARPWGNLLVCNGSFVSVGSHFGNPESGGIQRGFATACLYCVVSLPTPSLGRPGANNGQFCTFCSEGT